MTATVEHQLIAEPEFEDTHYGITVAHIGDDGEGLVALGHHEPRRALAAFNRHARRFVGLAAIWDSPWLKVAELLPCLEQRWGVFRKPAGEEDPGFVWVLDYTEADAPNARPVTLLWDR